MSLRLIVKPPPGIRGEIGARITREIATRLRFLTDVGLDYLTVTGAVNCRDLANNRIDPVTGARAAGGPAGRRLSVITCKMTPFVQDCQL